MATALDMERMDNRPIVRDETPCRPSTETARIEQVLLAALGRSAPCTVLIDDSHSTPQQGVDGDILRGAALSDGELLIRAWRNPLCLVASRRQAGLTAFAAARSVSEAAGWPVAVRRSGGTAVVHRPGVLNISLLAAQPRDRDLSVGGDYAMLLTVLRDMLAGIGVGCDQGDVPGAHCDGRYNLRWRGRKLAGTAGWIARPHGRTLRIFHASLLVGGAIEEDLRAIRRFETALGEPKEYSIDAHIGVEHILGDLRPQNDL
jgi:lipoate-protein ligase A